MRGQIFDVGNSCGLARICFLLRITNPHVLFSYNKVIDYYSNLQTFFSIFFFNHEKL